MGVTLKAAVGPRHQWPFVLTTPDVAWGIVASAATESAVRVIVR